MVQYIDKDALLARIKKLKIDIGNIFNEYDEGFWEGRTTAFDDIICALNTLEVKEVNLEKELDYDDYMSFFKEHPNYSSVDWGFEEAWTFAQYFYKLGLTQKGE